MGEIIGSLFEGFERNVPSAENMANALKKIGTTVNGTVTADQQAALEYFGLRNTAPVSSGKL